MKKPNFEEQIKEFDCTLEQSITSQPLSRQNEHLLELARQMSEDNPDPQNQIEERVWLKIQSHLNENLRSFQNNRKRKMIMISSTSKRTVRFVWSILLVGVLIGLLSFTPLGIQAQEWFRQIGNMLFTHAPTYAEQFENRLVDSTPIAPTDPQAAPVPWSVNQLLSVEDASALAGFQVLQPDYLLDGFRLVVRNVTVPDQINPVASVVTVYVSDSNPAQNFSVRQKVLMDVLSEEMPIGEARVTDVTVRGVNGLWIENLRLSTLVEGEDQVDLQYADILIWEENGYEFTIQTTASLSLETILMIADSLR